MKQNRMRLLLRCCTNMLLVLASVLAAIVAGEFVVRIFSPQVLMFNVSQWDPYVGFVHIPNIEGYSETKDFKMFVKINSHGLRDREFEYHKPPNTIRIGIFGDSFTFGTGVHNNESYPKVLEKLLADVSKKSPHSINVEVINFGIGKTGTAHQYAFYQKEGKKYQLDFVVLGFFDGNDFSDNWGGVFYLRGNSLVHNPTAYSSVRRIQTVVYHIPFYRWMATHSHLLNLLRKSVTLLDDRLRTKKASTMTAGEGASQDTVTEAEMTHLTLKLIQAFRKEVTDDKGCFLVVNIPAKGQKSLQQYSDKEAIPGFVKQWDSLVRSLAESDIKVLDLTPVFSVLPASIYYFENDDHMRAKGQETIASGIFKFLLPEVTKLQKQMGLQSTASPLSAETWM
jgi:hypothetical protein